MTTSVSGHTFYAVIKKNDDYSISACGFVCSSTPTNYIFQMLKDTHFSNICSDDEELTIEIIAIKNIGTNNNNKLTILDYLNNDKVLENDSIKSIMKFYSKKIKNDIKNDILIIRNSMSHSEFKSILNQILQDNQDNQFNNMYNSILNVELHLIVNNYNKQLYISNPSFSIDKNSMNYLLV